jgi:hypothetical protein
LLAFSLAQPSPVVAQAIAPVLRGRALEIVDDQGRIRASITLIPANPSVKMPDGTTGLPETVLLRLITSKGRPNVKIDASELGSGLMLAGESDPTYALLSSKGQTTSMKLIDKDGKQQIVKP